MMNVDIEYANANLILIIIVLVIKFNIKLIVIKCRREVVKYHRDIENSEIEEK